MDKLFNVLKSILRPFWNMMPWQIAKNIRLLKDKNNELDFLVKNLFLNDVNGVIHVGANTGQERYAYELLGLDVLWIEPIKEVFLKLLNNTQSFNKQICLNKLITDQDNQYYDFFITNNDALSSSMFELKLHKKIWPNVKFQKKIRLKSNKLSTMFEENKFDLSKYQALIIDTQGSELLVLKGSIKILNQFKYIKLEVSDFESYKNCCQLPEIIEFMEKNNYERISKYSIGENNNIGYYYDLTFKKMA